MNPAVLKSSVADSKRKYRCMIFKSIINNITEDVLISGCLGAESVDRGVHMAFSSMMGIKFREEEVLRLYHEETCA